MRPWREMSWTCTLKGARSAAASTAAVEEEDVMGNDDIGSGEGDAFDEGAATRDVCERGVHPLLTNVRHGGSLEERPITTLCIDGATAGVGGIDGA